MLPYIVLTASVLLLSLCSDAWRKTWNAGRGFDPRAIIPAARWTFFDLLAVTILVLFSGLRYEVGTDYGLYVRLFDGLHRQSLWADLAAAPQEAGFTTVAWLIRSFTDSPTALFLVAAILTVVPVYATIKRVSQRQTFALALYILLAFYLAPLNTVRQGIAVSLLFWAASYSGAARLWVTGGAAYLFHSSSIIATGLLAVLRRWRPTPATTVALAAVTAALAFGVKEIPAVARIVSVLNPRYGAYIGEEGTGTGAAMQIAAFIAMVVFVLATTRASAAPSPGGPKEETYLAYILVGIALMFIGTQAVALFRMSAYFLIFAVLWVPNRVANSVSANLKVGMLGAAAAAYGLFYVTNYSDLLPYESIGI